MKFTSMDITSKEFRKVLRGYDADEVDEFLDKIAEDYEALYKENSSLKEKLSNMKENVDHYSKMETTIQNTLLLAQNAAEQAKKVAQKESEIIIRNANETAERILDKAHNDVIKINDDYETAKHEFMMFETKFKNFMVSQLQIFENMEKDFRKSYNIGAEIANNIKEKEIDVKNSSSEDKNENKQLKDEGIKEELFSNGNSLDEIKNFFVK